MDYDALPAGTTVTFTPGSTRECVLIQITGETLKESVENFQVIAQGPSIQPGEGVAEVCINDDDCKLC